MASHLEYTKIREIAFDALHPNPQQAQTAAELLTAYPGILLCQVGGPCQLFVHYDIQFVSLEMIESLLLQRGLHLDNSLLFKLKRALYYYTENISRTNLSQQPGSKDYQRAVFINKYSGTEHGCRDKRPTYWREYK